MNFSEPRRIAHLRAQITSVAFSPNGARLAFACERRRHCALFLAASDGSNPVLLAGRENTRDDSYWNLQFSPDGTFLIGDVSDGDGEFSDICRIDVETGEQTRLTQDRTSGYPHLSPDGRCIVFQSWRDGVNDIYRMASDGGQVTRLTHTEPWSATEPGDPIRNSRPYYSPDGKWIAFLSSVYDGRRDNPCQLFVMHTDGSMRAQLTEPSTKVEKFLWHPDSQQIAFTAQSELPNNSGRTLWKYRTDLYMVGVDGGESQCLEFSDDVKRLGTFSPDGRYLAYYMSAGQRFKEGWRNWNIWLLDLEAREGNKPIIVTDNNFYDTSPLFSPDGTMLLFVSKQWSDCQAPRPDFAARDLYAVDIVQ